jgi:hypothetical protein
MTKLKRKNYQWIFCVWEEINNCPWKEKKEARMRTMMVGVTMSMDVVDHGRELGMGATVFLK